MFCNPWNVEKIPIVLMNLGLKHQLMVLKMAQAQIKMKKEKPPRM
jgi:hypothetical protein